MIGNRQSMDREARRHGDKGLEMGVIQEPLPVYQKEPLKDETRLLWAAPDDSRI